MSKTNINSKFAEILQSVLSLSLPARTRGEGLVDGSNPLGSKLIGNYSLYVYEVEVRTFTGLFRQSKVVFSETMKIL